MPDWLILLSTLGGLGVFGLSGFVIGPIIAAMFLSVWAMFAETWEQHEAVQAAAVAAAVPTSSSSAPPAQSPSSSDPSSLPPAS